MKSTIRIFILAAVAILALTMIAMLIVIGFQDFLTREFLSLGHHSVSGFVFPVAQIVEVICLLTITTVLCIVINNKKTGIVFEIIYLVLAVILLPMMIYGIGQLQPAWMSANKGAYYLAKYSSVTKLCSFAGMLLPLANGLSLVSCGMSIGRKCSRN